MKNKKAIFAGVALACMCVMATGLFILIREPFCIRKAGAIVEQFFGYRINADRITLSPALKAEITGLSIAGPKGGGAVFMSSQANIESSFAGALRGEVEKIILREPKIQIKLGKRKGSSSDLSFIKKLPAVDLVEVRKGELRLFLDSSPYEMSIKDISLDVRRFSPTKGGRIAFQGTVNVAGGKNSYPTVQGFFRGDFNLTRLFPTPIGLGVLEATVGSGVFSAGVVKKGALVVRAKLEDERILITEAALSADSLDVGKGEKRSGLKNVTVRTDFTYETKSRRVYANHLKGEIPGVGVFEGSGKGVLRHDYPWQAAIEAKDIDFAGLFAALGPFVAERQGEEWSVRGQGALKTELEGTMAGRVPGARGRASLQLKKGEFASKDGTKAGQGIDGEIVVQFRFPFSENGTKDINAFLSLSPGECLWGKYYSDLRKVKAKASSMVDLRITGKDRRVDFNGTANLFDTGDYLYRGSIDRDGWRLFVDLKDISNKKVFLVFLSEYLGQVDPLLKGAEVGGRLDAEINSEVRPDGLKLTGSVSARDAFFWVPEKSLFIDQVNISLPLNLSSRLTDHGVLREEKTETGAMGIKTFQGGPIELKDMEIPLRVSENLLWIPNAIDIPFFGGYIKILSYKVADLLSPTRRFYVTAGLQNVDLGAFMRELTGLHFPATMDARFPMIVYQDGKWITEGKTSVKIFGGEVELSNFYAQEIFAASRKVGGDIAFRDINLGSITQTIKIGRITGVVEGAVRGLEIEYGQPSRFVLDIDSVRKPGVKQNVSVDAIENIAILGTGSGGVGMVLKSGLNRFFKEYPYSRIGIRCTLENDTFHIRGKILEGKQEYLVRRGLLRGIDIINRDPDNTISFLDMQERIGRVFEDRKKNEDPLVGVN